MDHSTQQQQNTDSFFVCSGTYTKISQIPDHKTSLQENKRIKIVQNVVSDHNRAKLQINSREITNVRLLSGQAYAFSDL